MNKQRNYPDKIIGNTCVKRYRPITILIVALCTTTIIAGLPLNNRYDPMPLYSPMGTDKYYTGKEHFGFSFVVSPYYQHTVTASKANGRKVSGGNIFGNPNIFGTVYPAADILDASVQTASEQTMIAQLQALLNPSIQLITATPVASPTNSVVDLVHDPRASYSVLYNGIGIEYEKKGIRSQLNLDSGFGVGLSLRVGAADIKNAGIFPADVDLLTNIAALSSTTLQNAPTTPAPGAPSADVSTTNCVDPKDPCTFLQLLKKSVREQATTIMGISLDPVHRVDVEDVHIGAYVHIPRKFFEGKDFVFTFLPYASVGVWIPTAKERSINRVFDLSIGNDGLTGVTLDGALGFDFPDMLQFNIGAGIIIFPMHQRRTERIPSSESQKPGIFIPWQQCIVREPGSQWYFNVSFKADNITSKLDIPNISFFFDCTYTEHIKDEISIYDASSTRKNAFKPAILEQLSSWKALQMNAGLTYGITPNVCFAVAAQGYIGGALSYRTTNILGSIVMTF